MSANWILAENLYVWFALVAGFVDATFDEDDRCAIDTGIRDTDL
jgi:hypothetical protein